MNLVNSNQQKSADLQIFLYVHKPLEGWEDKMTLTSNSAAVWTLDKIEIRGWNDVQCASCLSVARLYPMIATTPLTTVVDQPRKYLLPRLIYLDSLTILWVWPPNTKAWLVMTKNYDYSLYSCFPIPVWLLQARVSQSPVCLKLKEGSERGHDVSRKSQSFTLILPRVLSFTGCHSLLVLPCNWATSLLCGFPDIRLN